MKVSRKDRDLSLKVLHESFQKSSRSFSTSNFKKTPSKPDEALKKLWSFSRSFQERFPRNLSIFFQKLLKKVSKKTRDLSLETSQEVSIKARNLSLMNLQERSRSFSKVLQENVQKRSRSFSGSFFWRKILENFKNFLKKTFRKANDFSVKVSQESLQDSLRSLFRSFARNVSRKLTIFLQINFVLPKYRSDPIWFEGPTAILTDSR